MIDITETLIDAAGNPVASATVIIETVGAPNPLDGVGLVGVTRRNLTTSSLGVVTASLAPGRYRMRWAVGTAPSEWVFVVPYSGGPYQIRHLGAGDVEAGTRQGWRFAGINGALLQLQNATTGEWHSITVDASAGADALALGIGAAGETSDGPNWKEEDDTFWLLAPVGGTWHAITVDGTDVEPVLAIGAAGIPADTNHRIKNGRRQFVNQSTTRFHSLFITGAAGSVTYALGPGEV